MNGRATPAAPVAPVAPAAPAAPVAAAGPLVEAKGVTRILPGVVPVTLVDDATLTIDRGEFVAITGPSGSGKSSLLYLLGLLDVPTTGSILFEGRETSALDEDALSEIRLARIGFIFQFHFLLPEFRVLGNVTLPMRRLGRHSDRRMRERGLEILGDLGLADEARKRVDQLSGGQRQRVAVARALANDPALILADEPTGNLDSVNAGIVFDIFEHLTEKAGRSVIVVTHDQDLAARADRRIHIVDGRVHEDD